MIIFFACEIKFGSGNAGGYGAGGSNTNKSYFYKARSFANETSQSSFVTLIEKQIVLEEKTCITIIGQGNGKVINAPNILDLVICNDNTIINEVNADYGWGSGSSHLTEWIPIFTTTTIELEKGTHTIKLKYHSRNGDGTDNTKVRLHGPTMTLILNGTI